MTTVLFVEPVAERGGAQVLGLATMQGLVGLGHRVHLAAIGSGPLLEEARERGVEVGSFPAHRTRNLPATLAAVLWLAHRVRRAGARIVHVQGTKTLVYGAPAARLAGARVVWHLYDPPPDPPSWIDRVAVRMPFDRAVAIVPGTARGYERLLGGRTVDVILPGLPDPHPDGAPTLPHATETVITVARLQAFKGHEVLAHAAHRVLAARPTARFLLVGASQFGLEPGYPERLARLIEGLRIGDRFQMCGWIDDARLHDAMARSALLVHPALSEPFGLVILEAMARALPVVATRTEGPSLIVEDGATGLLVPPGDPESLAGAILGLLQDRARAAALGAAGRDRFARCFRADRMVDEVARLYEGLVDARQPGQR